MMIDAKNIFTASGLYEIIEVELLLPYLLVSVIALCSHTRNSHPPAQMSWTKGHYH